MKRKFCSMHMQMCMDLLRDLQLEKRFERFCICTFGLQGWHDTAYASIVIAHSAVGISVCRYWNILEFTIVLLRNRWTFRVWHWCDILHFKSDIQVPHEMHAFPQFSKMVIEYTDYTNNTYHLYTYHIHIIYISLTYYGHSMYIIYTSDRHMHTFPNSLIYASNIHKFQMVFTHFPNSLNWCLNSHLVFQ